MTPVPELTRRRKLFVSLAVVVTVAAVVVLGTFAAFSATTSNTGNQFQAGSVKIEQHTAAATLYDVSDRKPGDSKVSCIRVTYSGSLGAAVKLYTPSTITNGTLYNLKVERGSGLTTLDATMSCDGFAPDATNPVAYDGPLGSFPTSYAGGAVNGKEAAWATGDATDYRFTITQNDDTTPNAHTTATSSGAHSFTWEARNIGDYAARVLETPGLVSYWRLGEASGAPTAADATAAHDATYQAGVTLGSAGALWEADTAARRTTFGNVAQVAHHGDFSIANTLSIEFWVKIDAYGAGYAQQVVNKSTGTADANYSFYLFGATAGGQSRKIGLLANAGGTWRGLTNYYELGLDRWYHVVATYDSAVGGRLYLNGTEPVAFYAGTGRWRAAPLP